MAAQKVQASQLFRALFTFDLISTKFLGILENHGGH